MRLHDETDQTYWLLAVHAIQARYLIESQPRQTTAVRRLH